MGQPPPISPDGSEFYEPEEKEQDPIDVSTVFGKIEQLGISDYILGISAGLIAFREARRRRKQRDDE